MKNPFTQVIISLCTVLYFMLVSCFSFAEVNINRVHIQVPIATVYEYITQPDKWHEWYPDSKSADTSGGSLKKGQTFAEVVTINQSDFLFNYEVVDSSFPSKWRVVYRSPIVAGSIQYELYESIEGTILTRTLEYFPIAKNPKDYELLKQQTVLVQQRSVKALSDLRNHLESDWLNEQ